MIENQLLPCPFCGQSDQVTEHTNSICCGRCCTEVATYERDGIAHQRWNTRPDYDNEAARLREIFEKLQQEWKTRSNPFHRPGHPPDCCRCGPPGIGELRGAMAEHHSIVQAAIEEATQ